MSSFLPFLLALVAGVSVYTGGKLAIRFVAHREIMFGLTGGLVVGVALLDLLPEAIENAAGHYAIATIVAMATIGFGCYLMLHRHPAGGVLGRATLVLHGIFDGFGMGLAFHISPSIGWLIAAAVLAHDMADGANMVGLCMSRNDGANSHRWLIAIASAPLVGVAIAQPVRIDLANFALLLALLAGGFLYIGASELLPHGRAGAAEWKSAVASVAGLGITMLVISFAH